MEDSTKAALQGIMFSSTTRGLMDKEGECQQSLANSVNSFETDEFNHS